MASIPRNADPPAAEEFNPGLQVEGDHVSNFICQQTVVLIPRRAYSVFDSLFEFDAGAAGASPAPRGSVCEAPSL